MGSLATTIFIQTNSSYAILGAASLNHGDAQQCPASHIWK